MAESDSQDLSQADIDAVGSKLASWADSLAGPERALAHILVERARQLTPGAVTIERIAADMDASVRSIVRDLNIARTPIAWARTEPVWNRANPRAASEYDYYGDENELILKDVLNSRR